VRPRGPARIGRSRGPLRCGIVGVALVVGAMAGKARADPCASPNVIETMPPDRAQGVPTNAQLFARYGSVAQYMGENVTLEHVGVDDQVVTATFDDTEGVLRIAPSGLVAGESYVTHWPGLHALDTSMVGASFDQHFEVGDVVDTAAPTFGGIESITWDVSRERDSCTGSVDERYVFDLTLGPAADDGGRDSLALLVFQTAGPDVDAMAPTPILVQRVPPAGQTVRVSRTVATTLGHVCFAAIVRDLTMKVSTSGPAACVDTVTPPFFYGCAASGTAGRAGWRAASAASALLLGALALRAGRRRRGDP